MKRVRKAADVARTVGIRILRGSHQPAVPEPKVPRAKGFVRQYRSFLPVRKPRRVVILGDFESRDVVTSLLESFEKDEVCVISEYALPEWSLERRGVEHKPAERVSQVVWYLRLLGPIDVLIDCLHGGPDVHLETWDRTFFHLRDKGVYAVSTSVLDDDVREALVQRWLSGQRSRHEDHFKEAVALPRRHEMDQAISRLLLDLDWIMVTKRGHHYLKVREKDATRVLIARSGKGSARILQRLPGGAVEATADVISHSANVKINNLDISLSYPPSAVRDYAGPIAIGTKCLAFKDEAILPESFRHPLDPNPKNAATANIDGDFARIQNRLIPRDHIKGTYYHLDSSNSGHFGHVMTEVLSRLWGWDVAKAAHPDLKTIFRIRYPDEREPELEKRLFVAYGISEEDILWVDHPVWVERLVGASPLWHNHAPFYANPHFVETWARIRSRLVTAPAATSFRLFVSRKENSKNRDCRNVRAVEDFFARHGFTVIHPEDLELSEQANVFAGAKVIAGFGGSGLFNLMYSQQLEKLIVLNQEAYSARNEHLYSLLLGCETHYFWSAPDCPHPPGRWTEQAYFSSWEFDFERNQADLEALFQTLD